MLLVLVLVSYIVQSELGLVWFWFDGVYMFDMKVKARMFVLGKEVD
jgi:hypothetical protein